MNEKTKREWLRINRWFTLRAVALAVGALLLVSGLWKHPWVNWLSSDIVKNILYVAMALLLITFLITKVRERRKQPEA